MLWGSVEHLFISDITPQQWAELLIGTAPAIQRMLVARARLASPGERPKISLAVSLKFIPSPIANQRRKRLAPIADPPQELPQRRHTRLQRQSMLSSILMLNCVVGSNRKQLNAAWWTCSSQQPTSPSHATRLGKGKWHYLTTFLVGNACKLAEIILNGYTLHSIKGSTLFTLT